MAKLNMYGLVADLVNMLMEHGANENNGIINTLKRHGLTNNQINEWYGLGTDNE